MGKVEILTKRKQKELPEPYQRIQYKNDGRILGEIIHMNTTTRLAWKHRLKLRKKHGNLQENKYRPTLSS